MPYPNDLFSHLISSHPLVTAHVLQLKSKIICPETLKNKWRKPNQLSCLAPSLLQHSVSFELFPEELNCERAPGTQQRMAFCLVYTQKCLNHDSKNRKSEGQLVLNVTMWNRIMINNSNNAAQDIYFLLARSSLNFPSKSHLSM